MGPVDIRNRKLVCALVYWREKRTIWLYEARDNDEYLRDSSAMSWRKDWPLEHGTCDLREFDRTGCYTITLEDWHIWMKECVHRGTLHKIAKRKPNKPSGADVQ